MIVSRRNYMMAGASRMSLQTIDRLARESAVKAYRAQAQAKLDKLIASGAGTPA
jgi:hypothetical protein